jgi:hypothetical protein
LSDEVFSALSEKAKAQGLTLSSLVALTLEQSVPKSIGTEVRPAPAGVPIEQPPTLLDRLQNVERWIQLLFAIVVTGADRWTIGEDVPCPGCGGTEITYVESGGATPTEGFVCTQCGWSVML